MSIRKDKVINVIKYYLEIDLYILGYLIYYKCDNVVC